jgi:hypothetical protein
MTCLLTLNQEEEDPPTTLEPASNVETKAICLENALRIKEREAEAASSAEVKATWQRTAREKKDLREAASNVERWATSLLTAQFRRKKSLLLKSKEREDASNVERTVIEPETVQTLQWRSPEQEEVETPTWKQG